MSYRNDELSTYSINFHFHSSFSYKPDLNIIKKAIGSLREEGLIALLPDIPEGWSEVGKPYKLTYRGKEQAEAIRELRLDNRRTKEYAHRATMSLKKERDIDRNKAIQACIVIIAIIVIFASFLLILGS